MTLFDLSSRVILVTGAAGHLGWAVSNEILRAGAELIIAGRCEEALMAKKRLLPTGVRQRCHVMACDITRPDAPERIMRGVESQFGQLHGLVNNAYAGKVGTMDSVDAEDFVLACNYNLIAPFRLVTAFQTLLEASASTGITASIVNIASMYGSVSPDPSLYGDSGNNNPVHYGATKGGMLQMTRYLACHLGSRGVRVNSVSPGPFPSPDASIEGAEFERKLAQKVPMGRVGAAEEVAGPIVFLLSDASSYVNGANIPVDGGWTAW